MTRKEKQERAEQKKEAIRKEIFEVIKTCETLENLNPTVTINKAIDIMKARNPQEAHFVSSVCSEIRQNPRSFSDMMLNKYGV